MQVQAVSVSWNVNSIVFCNFSAYVHKFKMAKLSEAIKTGISS